MSNVCTVSGEEPPFSVINSYIINIMYITMQSMIRTFVVFSLIIL